MDAVFIDALLPQISLKKAWFRASNSCKARQGAELLCYGTLCDTMLTTVVPPLELLLTCADSQFFFCFQVDVFGSSLIAQHSLAF
jgi:hypothetical protein